MRVCVSMYANMYVRTYMCIYCWDEVQAAKHEVPICTGLRETVEAMYLH